MAAPLYVEDLLDPISAGQPAGVDLRWTPEWDRIKEARRADDELEPGKWAKKERKAADWPLVQELTAAALRERSKDLQLAMWLTEASIRLGGWAGLRDGLRLARELIVRYWDFGLFPPIEDGPEDRAGPLQWLNDKLVDAIAVIPITARADGGRDYSYIDLLEARRVGSEAQYKNADGEIDQKKKKEYEAALAEGRISLEMFERAVKETRRAECEDLSTIFSQVHDEFLALEKVIEEKFGDAAPNFSLLRGTLRELRQEFADILGKKRAAEPDAAPHVAQPAVAQALPQPQAAQAQDVVLRVPLPLPAPQSGGQAVAPGSWAAAENLVRSGQVDQGLTEMRRLAAGETSGRDRFQRKLLLAQVCLATSRERLARSILEELAEQIDKYQLESWESSDLIGAVWAKLYQLYRQNPEDSSDADRAAKLYARLCRLDPWQALSAGE